MIGDWPLLTIVTFLPLFGALFLLMIRGEDEVVAQNARHVSLWVTGFTFLVSLTLLIGFDQFNPRFMTPRLPCIPGVLGRHHGVAHAD